MLKINFLFHEHFEIMTYTIYYVVCQI